jgi:cell division protein FtsN
LRLRAARRILAASLLTVLAARSGAQQANPAAPPIARISQLAANGDVAEARALVDSLITSGSRGPDETAELLFARASLAQSAATADSDYLTIVSSHPTSPRRTESLYRLAQQSMLSGNQPQAMKYLRQVSDADRSDSAQARVSYWMARTLLEGRDKNGACQANARALRLMASVDPALRGEIESQAVNSCAGVTPVVPAELPTAPSTPLPPATRTKGAAFSVQVAAFPRRTDAEQLAAKLTRSGLDARVDGTANPFRVRIGRYATYAEANAELRALKKRKLSGFVTAVTQ